MEGIRGRVALVTGAGSGIGRAIARELARHGARVGVADIDPAKAGETVAGIQAAGGVAVAIDMDVADSARVKSAFDAVEEQLGPVHILVNNAGIVLQALVVDVSDADWSRILGVNLTGVFFASREFARRAIARHAGAANHGAAALPGSGGRIINISSVLASKARPLNGPYCASKAGINGFTRALALELAPYGITVNAIEPGHIRTPLTKDMFTPEVTRAFIQRIPLGVLGEPEWIASVVAFLASDAACYITGQVLTVDGGFNMSGDLPGVTFGPNP